MTCKSIILNFDHERFWRDEIVALGFAKNKGFFTGMRWAQGICARRRWQNQNWSFSCRPARGAGRLRGAQLAVAEILIVRRKFNFNYSTRLKLIIIKYVFIIMFLWWLVMALVYSFVLIWDFKYGLRVVPLSKFLDVTSFLILLPRM